MSTVAVPKFGDQVTDSSGNTGIAVYDPNTGKLLQGASGYNPNTGTKLPTVKASSSKTTATPVITSSSAAADLANKKAAFNTVQSNNAIQAASLAQQKAQEAQLKQQQDKDMQAQKNVDTQNAQKQQEIAAKNAALGVPSAAQGSAPAQAQASQQPVPSYGSSVTDSSGNSGSAQFDPNTGKPLTPPAPTGAQTTQNTLNADANAYNSSVQDIQGQKDQLTNDFAQKLNSVLKGTFPLSGPQQALITSLQTQLAQNVASQTVANQSYVGQVSEASFRSGGEYTPEQSAGAIANAVSYGVQKIQELDNSAATTQADLEQAFQKDDYDMINTQYAALSKQLDDKSAAVKDMYETTVSAIRDQRDSEAAAAKTAFDENMQSENFDFTKSQTQIDNMFKQGQINETQRHDMQEEANERANTSIAASGSWELHDNPDGTQSMVNNKTGSVQQLSPENILTGTGTPGDSGVPIVDNNTKTTLTNIPYVDGSSLTGTQAKAAQAAAAKIGIPYIDKDSSTILGNIDTSRTNIQNVLDDLQGLNPSNGLTRPFVSAAHAAEGATQEGPGAAKLSSFAADQSALIQTIKGMMSLKIVNRGELNTIINGGGMPTPNDTQEVVQSKIQKINNALDAAERGVVGNTVYDKYNPSNSANQAKNTLNSMFNLNASQGSSPSDSTVSSAFSNIGI